MLLFGLILFIYVVFINNFFQNSLKEIINDDPFYLHVEKAYNERGIYILNDSYYINSNTYILGEINFTIKDDAIWRPKKNKYKMRISDIKSPFILQKRRKNDTIIIIKDGEKILLSLNNE